MVPGVLNSYQRDAVYGAVQQHIGPHQLFGSFGMATAGRCTLVGGATCTTNGLNGRQWSIGYSYSPTKTIDFFAAYYEMNNGRSGTYALFPPVVPVAPGVTSRGFGVGILYVFNVAVGGSVSKAREPEPEPEPPVSAPPAPAAPAADAPAAPEGA